MEKLIGYTELKVDGKVIPIKMGMYALTLFLEQMGMELADIGSLREVKKVDGEVIVVIKDALKFLESVIFAGANYASQVSGGDGYTIWDVRGWMDELGLNSDQYGTISQAFWDSINGKVIGNSSPQKTISKKKEPKK